MNLIFSINTKKEDTIESLAEVINEIKTIQSKVLLRCNLKNFDFEDAGRVEKLIRSIDMLKMQKFSFCELYLDLPYPHKKVRLHSSEERIIDEGELIIAYAKPGTKELYLDGELKCEAENLVIYGNGEGMLRVKENNKDYIVFQAINSMRLLRNKSISAGVKEITVFHEWQIEFLKKITERVDNVNFMLSFCDNAEAVILFKENILGKIQNVKVFAKIESLSGVNNISEIVEECDGIVVARGDLLLSAPMKDFYQNTIAIAKATSCARKQLIFVTDILKSLDTQNIPLRSEIIDYQIMKASGADAVILDSSVLYRKRTHILKDALDAL